MLRLALLAVAALGVHDVWAESHTTCKDPSVTWYNNQDGLNPCQQYEALRRLCDASYEVPILSVNTPGDYCDSQLHDCCCNSVAFALSMLCLNCQQGVGTGHPGDTGIDAGTGAYQLYLNGCGAGTNKSLPATTQLAVCNTGLHLKKYQYNLFWSDGPWFLEYTRQTASLAEASGTDDPGKCGTVDTATTSPTSIPPSTASSPSGTAAPMSSGSSAGNHAADAQTTDTGDGGSNTAVIVGAALGSAVVLILLIAFSCYLWRRRRNAQTVPPPPPHPNMYQAQPYAVQPYAGAQPYAAQSGTVGTVGTSTGRFHAGHMASASFSHSHSHAPSDVSMPQQFSQHQQQQQQPWSPRPPSSQSPPQYEYTASMSDLPPVPVTNHRIGGREDAAAALMGNYSSFDLAPPSPSPPPHANAGVTLLTGGPARGDRKVRVGARDPANSPPAY